MLYGRRDECAALDDLLARARAGSSAVVVIRGEAGIGKSALLEYAAEQAGDMRILRAQGVESETELPYAALHQLLRPVMDAGERLPQTQIAALRAALGLDPGEPDRFAVSVGLLGMLAEVAEAQPLLCLVDDAQWLDQASADALLFAARRMDAEPIAVIFTARDGTATPFEARGFADLRLAGLDVTDSGALLDERTGGRLSPLVRQRLVASTAGNPLALIELPAALTEDQLTGTMTLDGPLPLSDALERSFLDRMRALSADAQRLLLLAAAEESGDADVVLAAAAAEGLDAAAIGTVEDSGLLRFQGNEAIFRHPLVRSAIYQRAHVEDRRGAHTSLAAVLTGDAKADRRAWHRAHAAVGPDDDAAAELESTATRAQNRSGHGAAARALTRAAELSSESGPRSRRLVLAANSAWLAGRPEEAARLLQDAEAAGPDAKWMSEIRCLRGTMQLRRGNPATAHDQLMAAVTGSDDPLWMLMLAAEASSYAGRMDWMIAIGATAEDMPATGDGEVFVRSMLTGIAASLRADFATAMERLGEALAVADGLDGPHELLAAGTSALYSGQVDRALAFFDRAEARARQRGAITHIPFVLEMRCTALHSIDRYAEARTAATEGLALGRETGQLSCVTNHLANLAMVAAKQGREEECLALAGECLDMALPRGLALPAVTARWAVGVMHLGQGRAEEALGALDEAVRVPGVFHSVVQRRSAPDRFDAAIHCGRRDVAEEAVEHYGEWSAAPWGEAILERFAAMLTEGDDAEAHFEKALALHRQAPRPFEDARTCLAYGEFLRRQRRRTDARVQLRSAIEGFERLGAEPWAEKARAELRATGETARKRDPSTLDDLTPQELQIAKLVAEEGLSNPQIAARLFLSRRTIEYHLRKVYSKLGVASRGELATVDLV